MADKQVALVVGGGSGIGADVARLLSEKDYDVAVMSSSGKGEALGIELGGLGFTGSNLVVEDLNTFVTRSMDKFGRIDGVVNCTGHGPKGPVMDLSDDDWHRGMDYYMLNVVRMTRLVLPIMQQQGKGSIVNISTFAAFEPDADFPTSAIFRAALAGYTKLFTNSYAHAGLRMNNILPGFIDSLPEKEDRLARIPAGRYAKVRELSECIAFMISDASAYINGQNIRVDGGLTHSV